MTDDRIRLSRIHAEQDRGLATYLRRQVAAYSPYYRSRFAEAEVDARTLKGRADLDRLPFTLLADIDDPAALVLRPQLDQVMANGQPGLRFSMRVASALGQAADTARQRIDPSYKPLVWTLTPDGLPIGSAAPDLERLGELGRRWLEQAGVRPQDVLVSIVPPGPNVAFWQLQLGARRGGVSTLLLDGRPPAEELVKLQPNVLAGRPSDLVELLGSGGVELPNLTTVLAVGEPVDSESREQLADATGAVVVAAWAPPGVRAMWGECRGGDAFHLWPDSEVVEVADGELVWTALGWRGSVLVRLRTGIGAEVDESQCPTCGRTTPRLRVGDRRGAGDR